MELFERGVGMLCVQWLLQSVQAQRGLHGADDFGRVLRPQGQNVSGEATAYFGKERSRADLLRDEALGESQPTLMTGAAVAV